MREFLGDEINMLVSDLTAARNENEKLKVNAARRDEENRIINEELLSVRARCEEMTVENAAIHIILESVGQSISNGLQRYMERRNLRRENIIERTEPEQRKEITINETAQTSEESPPQDYNTPEERAERSAALAASLPRGPQGETVDPPVARAPVPITPRAAPVGSDSRMPLVDFGLGEVDEDLEQRMLEAVKDGIR